MCFKFLCHDQMMTRVLGRTSSHINKTTYELVVTDYGYTTTTTTTNNNNNNNNKAAFNKKKTLFTSKLDLYLRKKLVKCFIWSMALYGAETWTLRAADQ